MERTAENVEMQGIEFQIVNDSEEAVKGIERLGKALSNLKINVKDGISAVSRVGNAISKLRTALDGIDTAGIGSKLKAVSDAVNKLNIDPSAKISASLPKNIAALNAAVANIQPEKITQLGNALQAVADSSGAKVSAALPKNIEALNTALIGLDTNNVQKLTVLADALRPLGEIEKANLSATFIKNLERIPAIAKEFENLDMGKFADQMMDLAESMRPFADEMNKVAAGFAAFPSKIQKAITSTEQYNSVTKQASKNTYVFESAIKSISLIAMYKGAVKLISNAISRASDYQETLAMFNASMGEYAEEAYNYAQKVNEVMGIDPGEWMKDQGVFQSIITGFGVAGDKAAIMSRNLTQLGYDLSAFYNIDFSETMQKVRSGISGELEPLRNLGYDLSVARLQEEALALGITKKVSAMTQAEKAQLRYHTMMTQLTEVQGAMARELDSPNNQLRILKAQLEQASRAIGNLFIPILTKMLPPLIAAADALRTVISAIAGLLNIKISDSVNWGDTVSDAASSAADETGKISDNLSKASKSAKKLKNYLSKIDELNVLPDNSAINKVTGSSGNSSSGLDINPEDYNFISGAVTEAVDEWKKKLEPFTEWVINNLRSIKESAEAIATVILSWKLSLELIDCVEKLKNGLEGIQKITTVGLGGLAFLSDLKEFLNALKDLEENGADLSNVSKMIGEFAGLVGDIAMIKGEEKIAGVLKVVQGVGEIISAVNDIAESGVNWDNAKDAIRGLTNVCAGIGLLTGKLHVTAWMTALQGLTEVIAEIGKNINEIKKGDWSGVDKITLFTGALKLLGGVAIGLALLGKIKLAASAAAAKGALGPAIQSIGEFGISMSGVTAKLLELAKVLGLGIAVIAEVAAAAILVVGAIYALGVALQGVGSAWQPVIDNAKEVAEAVLLGVALLAEVGYACYELGRIGLTAVKNIAIGMAVLLEVCVATELMVAEIWLLGLTLQKVAESWEPVIDNSNTVVVALAGATVLIAAVGAACFELGIAGKAMAGKIAIGIAVLLEIGVATAVFVGETYIMGLALQKVAEAWGPVVSEGKTVREAILSGLGMLVLIGGAAAGLGLATIASAGTIPAAIGIGTAVMVEITVAVVAFTASITAIANQLSGSLAPALANVNAVLPALSSNMGNFTAFMGQFATQVAQYSASTAVSGMSSIVDRVVNLFAGNPIERFANSVEENGRQASNLTMKLSIAIPELQTACQMLESYQALVQKMNELLNVDIFFTDSTQLNMQEIGMNIVTGLAQGMVNGQPMLIAATTSTLELLNTGFVLPTQELFTNFFLTLDTSVVTSTQNINTSFLMSAETINNGFIVTLNAAFLAFFTTQTTQFMNLQTTIVTVFQQAYMAAVSGFISPVTAQTITMVSQLRALMEQLRAAIVASFQQAAAGVQSAFSILPGWFSGSVYSPIISMINSMLAEMRAAIAEANAAVSSIQSRTWSARSTTLRYRNYGGYRFPTFATGGFPDTGNMFIANEAGPEMVGTIGNRTAVANNDQIVEAVAAGVYRAVVQANSAQQSGGNRIEVYLSGKQVMATVAEEARRETLRTGVNPLTQGG